MTEQFHTLCERLDALATTPSALRDQLEAHELLLTVDDFTLEDAWQLGSWIREVGRNANLEIAVSIVLGAQRAFHTALPGAVANNDAWAARKIAVVQFFGKSSWRVGVEAQLSGSDINLQLPASEYAAHGGAFPLVTRGGSLLGAVAVSGLPSSHDHALVVLGLATQLGIDPEALLSSGA